MEVFCRRKQGKSERVTGRLIMAENGFDDVVRRYKGRRREQEDRVVTSRWWFTGQYLVLDWSSEGISFRWL